MAGSSGKLSLGYMPGPVQNGPNRWGFLGLRFHPPESHREAGAEQHTGQDDLTCGWSASLPLWLLQSSQLAMSTLAAGAETGALSSA